MADANSTPRQALFLADSDDEDVINAIRSPGQHVQKAPPSVDIDIDAIFADVDDDDDLFSFKPLAPALDTEALRREAELRHKNNVPPLTPHAILPSSSPPRDTGPNQAAKSNQGGAEAGKEGRKERRKPVRLDEGRLLGPTGFPQLIKNKKNFRTKGKGHEATDLNRLLQVYQFWTHEMFPPGQFSDTVDRVEKLCHSKRMNVALSVWRDEAHGKEVDDNEAIELSDDETRQNVKGETQDSRPSSGSARAEYASSSSPGPSLPPSSGTEVEDDDFDIDAVIREEVERNARKRAAAGQEQDDIGKGKGRMVVIDDDDDAMWNEMDPMLNSSTSAESSMTTGASGDDELAMWDAVDALEESSSAFTKPPVNHSAGEDEDMWDTVREIENTPAAITVEATTTGSTIATAHPPPPQDDDDEWEDMYV